MKELCDIGSVKALLGSYGFRFSRSMGQNFLIDPTVPERIAALSGADESHAVLEIGPGVGALTACLAPLAGSVTAVELDRDLAPILQKTLSDFKNVRIIQGDILKLDLAALAADMAPLTPMVCANLPYNITTPVLTALLDSGLFSSVTVMVQREVARRICAEAGSPDYGAFSVFCAYHARPLLLFDVPPESFIPAPKVWSSVVRMDVSAPPVPIEDEQHFFRTVRAAFAQRRKTLANSLQTGFSGIPRERLTEIIVSLGHDPRVRGEALTLADFAALSEALKHEAGA